VIEHVLQLADDEVVPRAVDAGPCRGETVGAATVSRSAAPLSNRRLTVVLHAASSASVVAGQSSASDRRAGDYGDLTRDPALPRACPGIEDPEARADLLLEAMWLGMALERFEYWPA
jgi:hypothetical protein